MPLERTFQQARSRVAYAAFLAAAREVFAKKGFEDAAIADIASAANLSVGSFYRYFTDKRHIFLEAMRQCLDEGQSEVIAKLKAADARLPGPRAVLDRVLDAVFEAVAREPELAAVFLSMSLRDPDVARLREEIEARGCEELAAMLEAGVSRRVLPDARAAAFVMSSAVREVAVALTVRRQKAFKLDERHVKAALKEMFARYLKLRAIKRAPQT